MKAQKIFYKKLFSLGNYENEEIGIEIQVEECEKAKDVLLKARQFVDANSAKPSRDKEIQIARGITENPDNYTYRQVMKAKELIENLNNEEADDLPF